MSINGKNINKIPEIGVFLEFYKLSFTTRAFPWDLVYDLHIYKKM